MSTQNTRRKYCSRNQENSPKQGRVVSPPLGLILLMSASEPGIKHEASLVLPKIERADSAVVPVAAAATQGMLAPSLAVFDKAHAKANRKMNKPHSPLAAIEYVQLTDKHPDNEDLTS